MIEPYTPKDIHPYLPDCMDIETNSNGETLAIGLVVGSAYYVFDNYGQFIDTYLSICDKKARIYAHNGANFDYLALLEYLHEHKLLDDCKYIMSDGSGIGVLISVKDKTISLFDSYRLMPASLAKLSSSFNVKDKKIDINVLPEVLYREDREKFYQYLKNDVYALQQVVYAFWQTIYTQYGSVGLLPMTLPALSLRLFRKTLEKPIMTPNNLSLKEFERQSYHGGLTMCLYNTEARVNVYDVNSMYPAMMVNKLYPTSYSGFWTNNYVEDKLGIYEVTFNQSKDIPPFLFVDNELSFEGRCVVTSAEIEYMKELGLNYTIIRGYVYLHSSNVFREYVGETYQRRKEATVKGDDALSFVLKILLNSLYGKFAQREESCSIYLDKPGLKEQLVKEKVKFYQYGSFVGIVEEMTVPHVFTALSSFVTAYARVHLHKMIVSLLKAGNKVYYCDTDSIHTDAENIPTDNELGGLKLEYSGMGVYVGKKLYAIKTDEGKEIVRAKGIGRIDRSVVFEATRYKDINYELMRKLLNVNNVLQTEYNTFPSVKETLSGAKAVKLQKRVRKIRNTGGIYGALDN